MNRWDLLTYVIVIGHWCLLSYCICHCPVTNWGPHILVIEAVNSATPYLNKKWVWRCLNMNFCPTSHSFLSDSRQAVSTYLCLVKGIPLVWMPRALVWAFWPDAAPCLKLHHTSHATKCCVARVQAQKSSWLSRFHQQILGLEILNHDKMTCCVRMYETCPGWQDTAFPTKKR